MSISSLGAAVQNYASQLYAAQQTQAVTDPFLPDPSAANAGSAAPTSTPGSNSLTGTGTASLDSQTLQALLGLTQQDPSDPSQQSGQMQGAHHHHHHHGGGAPQTSSPSTATSPSPSATDPASAAGAAAEAEDVDASLETALLSA